MYLQYTDINESADSARKSNLVLAGFTTAHARTVLYKYMQRVKKTTNIFFCDADSIMYIDESEPPARTQNRDIPLGNILGCMTDEISEKIENLKFYNKGLDFFVWVASVRRA